MRVAVVQHEPVWEDAAATCARLTPVVAAAAAGGARLVVLPEMFATGFSMRTDRTAEPEDGPTVTWMRAQAEAHDVWLLGSVPERRDDDVRPRNCCHVVAPSGDTVARYDKVHRFTHAGEDEHVAPQQLPAGGGVVTVDVAGVRVTPIICYDLRFADLTWQAAAQTDCFVVPASWPAPRREHWRTLLRARAIENQAWVVAANRVGSDDGLDYVGDSVVVDPMGRTVAEAAHRPTTLFGDIDAATVATTREAYRFMADRH
jgi:predicted amidohydrolase